MAFAMSVPYTPELPADLTANRPPFMLTQFGGGGGGGFGSGGGGVFCAVYAISTASLAASLDVSASNTATAPDTRYKWS